jgi:hypothetical protein
MNAVDLAKNNAVEVRKIAYRQSKDGMVISFVLHPSEVPEDLATAPVGQRYMMVAVRIGDDEQPEPPQPAPQKAGKRKWHEMPASQRAGLLCNDHAFIQWSRTADAGACADWLRQRCGVHSRATLDTDEHAARRFARIEEDFNAASGRAPSFR